MLYDHIECGALSAADEEAKAQSVLSEKTVAQGLGCVKTRRHAMATE
jgi:hypothetical protein